MYEIFRTAFDGNGQPMRLTITVYPTDRNQFIIKPSVTYCRNPPTSTKGLTRNSGSVSLQAGYTQSSTKLSVVTLIL